MLVNTSEAAPVSRSTSHLRLILLVMAAQLPTAAYGSYAVSSIHRAPSCGRAAP